MIREDNVTLQTLQEDLAAEHISLKEYIGRNEGALLFTVAINKHLLNSYKSFPSVANQVFTTVPKGDGEGRQIRFPNIWGCNPKYIPELSEVPFDQLDISAVTVQAEKFGLRMGISQEMIDDNEVSLINWTVGMVGTKMAELRDQEAFKMLDTYHATGGGGVDSTINTFLGNQNRGATYTTATLTNDLSATAVNWEVLIATAITTLKTQTVTLLGQTYRYPVYADTLIVPSLRELAVRKVINVSTVVMATGLGHANAAVTQLAGSNLFQGILNVVASPYVGRGQSYIVQKGRGLVIVEREAIRVDRKANWEYEAEEVKAISRFMPAVIDERSIFGVYLGTA